MNGVIVVIIIVEVLLLVAVGILLRRNIRKNKISFQETLDLLGLPVVTFYNNGRKLNFILDTGANKSSINERELIDCTFKEMNGQKKMMGIDGINNVVRTIELKLTKTTNTYTEVFQVTNMSPTFDAMRSVSGVEVHGLLGSDFFAKHGYILDYADLTIYTH